MARATHHEGGPDAVGLAVAKAAQDAVAPDTVILFGSRARGDHRPDSDVDLMVVANGNALTAMATARNAAKAYFEAHPPRLGIDIVPMERKSFEYARRARNHVAGQAAKEGIIMNGQRLESSSQRDDGYPASWPDVKERLQAAYRQLGTFNKMMEAGDFPQEDFGFHAQQAVENALKAWMSATDIEYGRVHDLADLARLTLADVAEAQSLAGAQLHLLIAYTNFTGPDHASGYDNWLTLYAAFYRYSGAAFRMSELDMAQFHQEINLAVRTFANRAHEMTGTAPSDLS